MEVNNLERISNYNKELFNKRIRENLHSIDDKAFDELTLPNIIIYDNTKLLKNAKPYPYFLQQIWVNKKQYYWLVRPHKPKNIEKHWKLYQKWSSQYLYEDTFRYNVKRGYKTISYEYSRYKRNIF